MNTIIQGDWHWPEGTTDKAIHTHLARMESMKHAVGMLPEGRRGMCVQAGGSHGMWPKWLASQFKLVYTFEPEPNSFDALCQNVRNENVMKIQGALSYRTGTITLKRKGDSSHHIVAAIGDSLCFKLDNFILPHVDAILLDVEGHEPEVLIGCRETIRRCRPMILIEYNARSGGTGPKAEEVILSEPGYVYVCQVAADRIYKYKDG